MTKDRARKQDARKRAALTGEPYVVAKRAIADPQPVEAGGLHGLMHTLPGVPTHVNGGMQAKSSSNRSAHQSLQRRARQKHQHNEPRVLVAWQNWIARRLHAHPDRIEP